MGGLLGIKAAASCRLIGPSDMYQKGVGLLHTRLPIWSQCLLCYNVVVGASPYQFPLKVCVGSCNYTLRVARPLPQLLTLLLPSPAAYSLTPPRPIYTHTHTHLRTHALLTYLHIGSHVLLFFLPAGFRRSDRSIAAKPKNGTGERWTKRFLVPRLWREIARRVIRLHKFATAYNKQQWPMAS